MTGFFDAAFRGTDSEETEDHLRAQFGRLALLESGSTYVDSTVGDSTFSLTAMRFRGGFECEWEPRSLTVAASSSDYRWDVAGERGTGADGPMLFVPGTRVAARVEWSRAAAVSLQPAALQETARALYSDDRLSIRFESVRPASEALGRAWVSAVRTAAATAPLLQDDLLRRSVSRTLAVMTLECFQLAGDRPPRALSFSQQLVAYRRAVQFLDDHASLPISIDDAARAAGLPTADLVRSFRLISPLGLTPGQYLRRTRLAAAHTDLINGDPTLGDTVGAISSRWGFASPSHFARLHRTAYGANPRWVLDR